MTDSPILAQHPEFKRGLWWRYKVCEEHIKILQRRKILIRLMKMFIKTRINILRRLKILRPLEECLTLGVSVSCESHDLDNSLPIQGLLRISKKQRIYNFRTFLQMNLLRPKLIFLPSIYCKFYLRFLNILCLLIHVFILKI